MLRFYFDEMMPHAAAQQLRQRGYEVMMAVEIEMTEKDDSDHLVFAREHNLVIVTFDRAFAGKTAKLTNHAGLICLSGPQNDIGSMVRTVSEFAEAYSPQEVVGRVFWF